MLSYCIKRASNGCSGGRVRVYSVATDNKGRVLSENINTYTKTSPLQKKYASKCNREHRVFLHSEIRTLSKCLRLGVIPSTLYIARVDREGNTKPASPCPVCELFIKEMFPLLNVIST